mmetsp:Transcript_92083/g.204402  ORF Transcript_92083/g.204402 Transcript_92083/m.204402 type:complete len:734 (+) Transcript_92083:42-2243(+)
MSCPYCLTFSLDEAKRYQHRKTLVRAYWEFEDTADHWMGFSPAVSQLLESSYANWMKDPQLRRLPQVKSGMFLYNVDFASMKEANKAKSQRIRRVGVTNDDAADPTRTCTVESKIWKEFQADLQKLRKEIRELKNSKSDELDKCRRQVTEKDKELSELRDRCAQQEKELERLRSELVLAAEARERLLPHLTGIYPGRLVTLATPHETLDDSLIAIQGAVGRVRALEGPSAAVDFPGRVGTCLPCTCLQLATDAELLTRPGTRVTFREHDSGHRQRGVVCDCVDGISVNVLGVDGKKRTRNLQDLEIDSAPRPADLPLEAGDFVQVSGPLGLRSLEDNAVPANNVGMVIRSSSSSVSIRFKCDRAQDSDDDDGEHVDLSFDIPSVRVQRQADADRVRPGAAVRFRTSDQVATVRGQGQIGIVYATHGDGTAIVDFLGNVGCRCNAALLEVLDHPATVDHAVLRMLSECLSWHEISTQRGEEREEEGLLRFVSTLPSALTVSIAHREYTTTEWGSGTDLFQFIAKVLVNSLSSHRRCDESDELCDPPILSINQIEGVCNPSLQQAYELGMQRTLSVHSNGVTTISEIEALRVLGSDCNEVFLWQGVPMDKVDQICREGFDCRSESELSTCVPLRFEENASLSDIRGNLGSNTSASQTTRCLVLARVLLGESLAVREASSLSAQKPHPQTNTSQSYDSLRVLRCDEGGVQDHREYRVYYSHQALPIFRIFYSHEAS